MIQPKDVAASDQHFAKIGEQLDILINTNRSYPDLDPVHKMASMAEHLACPHMADGTDIGREAHAGTLASLLAVAIERLSGR